MKAARLVLATVLALVLQTMLAKLAPKAGSSIDMALIVVVYAALTSGPVTGLLTGTFAGLLQDTLASPVIGIGGLAKTIVGFLTGVLGTQFIVANAVPRFVVFFGATIVHEVVSIGLYELLDLRHFGVPYGVVGIRALGNAFVGVVAFQMVERMPAGLERRRARRRA